jgi:hypothetical protein
MKAAQCSCALALVLPIFTSTASSAESTYFPGVFVREGSSQPVTEQQREELQLKCLLAPDIMHADGKGAGYFLDAPLFNTTGQVSYVKSEIYACRYAPEARREICESEELSDGKSLRYYRTNIYQTFTPQLQRGHTLMTAEEVAEWNSSGKLNPANAFGYHTCECITDAMVESRAAPGINTLDSAQTGDRRYWSGADPSPDDYDTARKLQAVIGTCKPKLS